jgi:hypothetical protein
VSEFNVLITLLAVYALLSGLAINGLHRRVKALERVQLEKESK